MKKSFKLKALVLSMLVMMGLTLVPSLYAVEPFKNHEGVTAENADFLVSYMASETTLTPGQEFTVTVNVEKMPERGIVSLSNRIAYDSRVVEPITRTVEESVPVYQKDSNGNYVLDDKKKPIPVIDEETGKQKVEIITTILPSITPGTIGTGLGLTQDKGTIIPVSGEPDYIKAVAFNAAETGNSHPTTAGVYATIKFRVKDNPEGKDAGLVLLQDGKTYNGFAIASQYFDPFSGKYVTDTENTFFINSNLSNVQVPVACEAIEFTVDKVELDKTTNPSYDLSGKYVATPTNTTEDISWDTEDHSVATVSNGVVTAVGNGTTNVVITCGSQTATLPVTVTTSVGTVSFKGATYTVNFEEDRDLSGEVVVGPQGATAKSITYTSSNPDAVSVDNNGVIRGLKYGTSDITVNVDGKTATVTVSVVVPLRTITLDKTSVEVYKGDKVEINVTAGPEGAVVESLVSAPKSGAEFAKTTDTTTKITVEGLKEGTAVYTVSANGNTTPELQKEFTVVVKENPITSATIKNAAGAEILRGETLTMEGAYTTREDESVHKTTDDPTMVWSSSDETVAKVDPATGVVTGVKEGKATITLTIAGKTATYEVTVNEIHVSGIQMDEDKLDEIFKEDSVFTVGDSFSVDFTLLPEGKITDTLEEILAGITTKYDKDLVDVKVEYNKETGKGTVTVTLKAAGDVELSVAAGEPDTEDAVEYTMNFTVVEPVVEEPEAPETGDMSVAMMVVLMAVSAMGVVASKKILVK